MVNTVYFLTLDLNSSTFVFLITNGPLISSFWQRELIQGTKHFPTGMFVLSPPPTQNVGGNDCLYSSNPRRVGIYNAYTWASIYMGSIYSNTPPQSELPAQRCSRLDNKKANTPAVWTTDAAVFKTGQEESTKGKYPPQPQLATGYVEAGSKLREGRWGQPLGEDVSKLGGSRDMEYPNIADGDPVVHKV